MRLDKWYYTNQDENDAKHCAQQLVRYILRFPPEVYERKPVKIENKDMPRRDDLIAMLIDDGFPEWAEAYKKKRIPVSGIAVEWTRMSYLREISEGEYNTVLMSDNIYPLVSFSELTKLLSVVPDDIYALKLVYRDSDRNTSVAVPTGEGALTGYKLFSGGVGTGFYYLFTPEGAGVFLDLWRQMPEIDFRKVVLEGYQKDPDNFPTHKWYVVSPNLFKHARHIIGEDTILSFRDHQ